jgi:hypothetical protein
VHFGKAEINQRIDIAICDCINAAPSGPPNGLNFSRQKDATPLPPSPAMTSIFASSINFIIFAVIKLKRLYLGQSLSIEGFRLTLRA